MEIIKYPDGTSYAKGKYKFKNPNITFKVNSYEDLWYLNQIVDALNAQDITPIITIPNLIDAQADRRFNHDESSGLKLICQFLNNMDAYFKIFHPHNPEVVEALMNNVEIIDNSEFIKKVLTKIPLFFHGDIQKDVTLMSSDAGGFKPLMKLTNQLNWKGESLSCSKYRPANGHNNHKLIQQVPREDFEGKDILIIDDISIYGGTFKGLSKLLKDKNCGKLYLAVSHMTVQNLGEDPVTNYFDRVFTTNSKFDRYFRKTGEDCNSNLHYAEEIYEENLEIIKLF